MVNIPEPVDLAHLVLFNGRSSNQLPQRVRRSNHGEQVTTGRGDQMLQRPMHARLWYEAIVQWTLEVNEVLGI